MRVTQQLNQVQTWDAYREPVWIWVCDRCDVDENRVIDFGKTLETSAAYGNDWPMDPAKRA